MARTERTEIARWTESGSNFWDRNAKYIWAKYRVKVYDNNGRLINSYTETKKIGEEHSASN